MSRPDNIQHLTPEGSPASGNNNGNGRNLHGRVSALEAHLHHLATKEDISEIKVLISERETLMLRWLIGIISIASITLIAAILRTFL
ncbi:MAG: hypothetical protein OXC26_17475 [Albidovulum sp.]|nr:hypothetical protein [Albidovulum sp.]